MTSVIQAELDRLKPIRDDNHWNSVRGQQNFIRSYKKTSTGDRAVWITKSSSHNKDLQSSRSVGLKNVETVKDIEKGYEEGMKITHADSVRIQELVDATRILNNNVPDIEGLEKFKIKGMCEIGFRYPRLMKYYQDKYNIPVKGYDVSTLAVEYAKTKGYDVRNCDLNKEVPNFKGYNLLVMYHVLEHLEDPERFLMRLYENVEEGTICHFEVPIELNEPQYEYGHLFGFHPGDLLEYILGAGFAIVSVVTKNICGKAFFIERVLGVKISGQ